MSQQSYKVCFFFRRRFSITMSEAPHEIKTLFDHYSEKGTTMSVNQFQKFLIEVQKEDKTTIEDAQAIINSLSLLHRRGLHLEAFFKYLFADINPPLSPLQVKDDMSAPLSHYFIYTGHNSYLTGNQLSSDCSDIPIIQALDRGVRVIELDLWPNSDEDGVNVLHGRTLTTPVELITCLKAIKEHAFVASEYPVIVTLEDHLTPDLQAKVAKMLVQVFGDMLFTPGSQCFKEFPSPETLKRRILVSTKPPKEYLSEKKTSEIEQSSDEDQDECDSVDEDGEEEENVGDRDLKRQQKQQYRELIGIQQLKPTGGLKECLKVDPTKANRLSLSESKLEKAVETHSKEIVRFTQQNLLRIYPKGVRVDSSNYNPLIAWTHGAQMVAFNMQGHGKSMWLMHGMFRANGGCGYVKKPDFLLKTISPVKTTLKVTIYMGEGWYYDFKKTHFDNYSPPDFYARVGIAGVPADAVMKKTKIVDDNWVPAWNEVFEFPLSVPELALLRLEVYDADDLGGQTCLPVWELRQGIRAVPVHNDKGDKYKSVKLLMRFEFV